MSNEEDALIERVVMLEEALMFYAAEGHVLELPEGGHGGGDVRVVDFGQVARYALGMSEKPSPRVIDYHVADAD